MVSSRFLLSILGNFISILVSHLRQAFVKVAKTTAVFNRWKQFAKDLGVSDDKIQTIEASGGSGQEKCFSSLESWKDEKGERATVTALAEFLKAANQERLSRELLYISSNVFRDILSTENCPLLAKPFLI